ncbi:MAG: T9SS type A sorting domain-containing protein [Chitinophagales bacterium]|nr:T9SS type A sorting domain-containing protein [Chitinophagales bacterium]
MKTLSSFLFLSILLSHFTYAQPGLYDDSFGTYGRVQTMLPDTGDIYHVLQQDDGKIVAAGLYRSGGLFYKSLLRYTTDGLLDTSFAGTGYMHFEVQESYADPQICLDSDGNILFCYAVDSQIIIYRITEAGIPDSSFGEDGRRIIETGAEYSFSESVSILSSNKIVITAIFKYSDGNMDIAFVQLLTDGSPDISFGTEGIIVNNTAEVNEDIASAVLQEDENILIAGNIDGFFAVWRFLPDGTPDATFGTEGLVTDYTAWINLYDLVLQPDHKIVVCGTEDVDLEESDVFIARLLPDGTFDNTFSEDGKYSFSCSPEGYARSVVLQTDGKIVIGGNCLDYYSVSSFYLVRIMPEGIIDHSFNQSYSLETFSYSPTLRDILLQDDNKIVAAGKTPNGTYNEFYFSLARYINDCSFEAGIYPSADTVLCMGDTLFITTDPADSYSWSDGSETNPIAVTEADEYFVYANYMGECSALSDTVVVTFISSPDTPVITSFGDSLICSVAWTYQWYLDGMLLEGATTQSIAAGAVGVYTVEVTNEASCNSFSDPWIVTSLNDPTTLSGLIVYPNPVDQQLTVFMGDYAENFLISIKNTSGEILFVKETGNQNICTLEVSSYPPGIYFVELYDQKTSISTKFIKE